MFFCEYCEIFKNIYFEKHLRTAASRHYVRSQLHNLRQTPGMAPKNALCCSSVILVDLEQPFDVSVTMLAILLEKLEFSTEKKLLLNKK